MALRTVATARAEASVVTKAIRRRVAKRTEHRTARDLEAKSHLEQDSEVVRFQVKSQSFGRSGRQPRACFWLLQKLKVSPRRLP